MVGTTPLPLVGVSAVVIRDHEILLGRRSDSGALTPVTGIVDPGEEPADDGDADERLLHGVHEVVGQVPPEVVGALQHDVPADPQHGDGSDKGDPGEHGGHPLDEERTEALRGG